MASEEVALISSLAEWWGRWGMGRRWGGLGSRAGPQSKKWSDQQITLNPTGSIHKKARKKKFDPKKVDFDEGDCT